MTTNLTKDNIAAWQLLRLLLVLALLLWLLPLGDLLGHESDPPTILERYSPSYMVLLAAYGTLALGMVALWRATPRIVRRAPYPARRVLVAGVLGLMTLAALWVVLFEMRTTFKEGTPVELYLTWLGWGVLFVIALCSLRAASLPERLTWRRHGAMVAIPTLVTLVMLEILLRLTFPYGLQTETNLVIDPGQPNPWQPYTGIAYSAGVEFIYQSSVGYRTHVKVNAHGLRDLDYPYEKPPGVYRILILGDSMLQAIQVPLEETFQQRLEIQLQAEGYPVEVIAAGIGSWGTSNEALYLEYEGCRYQPDLVLLAAFPTNDIGNNDRLTRFWQIRDEARSEEIFQRWIDYPYFELGDDGDLTVHNIPSPQIMPQEMNVGAVLARISLLYLTFHEILNPERPPDVTLPLELMPYYTDYPGPEPDELRGNGGVHLLTFSEPETPALAGAWRMTMRLIERVRDLANGCGADMGVVIVPSYLDQTPLADNVNARWARLAERDPAWGEYHFRSAELHLKSLLTDIPTLNLMMVMPGSDADVFLPRDGHFTSEGNAEAATAIHDWLVAGVWLPELSN